MATNELMIKGHIVASVNLLTEGGEPFCHVLIEDDAGGDAFKAALDGASIIYDKNDKASDFDKNVDPKYKQASGEPIHVYDPAGIKRPQPVKA